MELTLEEEENWKFVFIYFTEHSVGLYLGRSLHWNKSKKCNLAVGGDMVLWNIIYLLSILHWRVEIQSISILIEEEF